MHPIYICTVGVFFLQASEQYFTDSQFLAHDFLHVISFLQTTQIFLGRKLLLPLKEVLISNPIDCSDYSRVDRHAPRSTSGLHH